MNSIERVIAWLEAHPRVERMLDRPAIVRPLGAVLARADRRAHLDIQLRCLGAPGAKWWETTARLERRLFCAYWGDEVGNAVARDGFHVQCDERNNGPADIAARRMVATIRMRGPDA
jgi:hypothetical protein